MTQNAKLNLGFSFMSRPCQYFYKYIWDAIFKRVRKALYKALYNELEIKALYQIINWFDMGFFLNSNPSLNKLLASTDLCEPRQ